MTTMRRRARTRTMMTRWDRVRTTTRRRRAMMRTTRAMTRLAHPSCSTHHLPNSHHSDLAELGCL